MIRTVCRLLLGLSFAAAGLAKISGPWELYRVTGNYHILPDVLARLLAVVLPWTELVLGTLLCCGCWVESGALLAGSLSMSFAIANSSALWRNLDISCGCFGKTTPLGWPLLGLDLGLLALSAFLLTQGGSRLPANPCSCETGESLS